MLKLACQQTVSRTQRQPPSGGCVLKRHHVKTKARRCEQPPSGGCVLKPSHSGCRRWLNAQPPSGGCVLKLGLWVTPEGSHLAAAFGRLCVETIFMFAV